MFRSTNFGSCTIVSCWLYLDSVEGTDSAVFIPFFEFERIFSGILFFGLLLGTKLTLSFSGVVCVAACATPVKTSNFCW